jgi:hypothetical protein
MSASVISRTARGGGSVAMSVLVLVLAGCSAATSSTGSSPAPSASPSSSSPSVIPSSPTPSVSPSSATPSTPSPDPTSPATVTTIVVTVRGCPTGCRIFAAQDGTRADPTRTSWQVSALVRDGRVTLKVPVARTKGLHFSVGCPGDVCNSSNAAPVVALRYRGLAVGATVTDAVARTRTQASGCWAGTTAATASFALHVTVFPDTILTRRAHSIRAWMSPQVAVVPGTWESTYHGGLGTQDSVIC